MKPDSQKLKLQNKEMRLKDAKEKCKPTNTYTLEDHWDFQQKSSNQQNGLFQALKLNNSQPRYYIFKQTEKLMGRLDKHELT